MSTENPKLFQIRMQGLNNILYVIDIATTEKEFNETTVLELKTKIQSQAYPHLKLCHIRLLFGGKQLEEKQPGGEACTLEYYRIRHKALLIFVIRAPGGSTGDYISKPAGVSIKVHDPNDSSLKFTDEQDCIDPYSDSPRRIKMSCGHAVDATSLTSYCLNLIDKGEYKMHCPAIIDKRKYKACGKVWEYTEVRQAAKLNDAERQWFESKIATFAAKQYWDMKECPGCHSFIERQDLTNLRVHCLICTRKKGKTYDFCWHCLNEWIGPTTKSSTKCDREECVNPDLSSIQNAPMIKLNGFDVPNRRACPNCGQVAEHDGTRCKMMICNRCRTEFCFLCLERKEDCLKTSPASWYGKCEKPIAPKQTSIPVWRH